MEKYTKQLYLQNIIFHTKTKYTQQLIFILLLSSGSKRDVGAGSGSSASKIIEKVHVTSIPSDWYGLLKLVF